MQRNDKTDPRETGEADLTTEDLAQPSRSKQAPEGPTEAPAFPGESTSEPRGTAETPASKAGGQAEEEAPHLLAAKDAEGFRARWQEVQNEFVDDPRDAVHDADALVADVMQQLASTFAEHRQELEGQWDRSGNADTEELRLAIRDYRSFFNRLLAT
ncbi:hypothetical protein SRB17_87600 [Streptomyces sp. RB17]|uniref:hypothetical protein n=1 Tax=Streptomyces sp. RB17 TaxID=2585197 RepID=UPI0012976B72|nr:hypothetical protein [Streptomyces sp. RB17]MQY40727.1 hypothetical protein [Streptomyces sp. RB17]